MSPEIPYIEGAGLIISASIIKGMIGGADECYRLRAAIADLRGQLDRRDWETSSAKVMKHLWLSDCEDLVSHLHNPVFKTVADKRLSIDIARLRQMIWDSEDGTLREE